MKLKPLEHYLDNREDLLDMLLKLMEPERLLLPTEEWLSSIHPRKWRILPRKTAFRKSYLYVTVGLTHLQFYERDSGTVYSSPLGDYRKFIENIYEEVYARLPQHY